MAAADLLVVILNPLLKWTAEIYFPRSFLLITAVCRPVTWLMFASTATSVWLTVAFTVDRFVAICCEKLKTKYCTERTAAVVIGTVSVLACLETVPWGFVYGAGKIIDGVSWYCVLTPSFTNSPSWAAFEIFHRIFYLCVPFILMLLFNILTVRRILAASRARRGLRGQKSGENDKDREMENRRKSIVLLFSITGLEDGNQEELRAIQRYLKARFREAKDSGSVADSDHFDCLIEKSRHQRPNETRKAPVENVPSTNLVAIVILSRGKCGLSKCITLYLVGMAAADLLVIISNPLLKWTAGIYFSRSFLLITAVCRPVTLLIFASTATSVWLTVAFTVDRFVAICCEKLKTKYCTERTAAVVIGTVSVLACFETVPSGFVYESGETIDGVSWYCVLTPSFTNSTSWAAFYIFHRMFYPCVPFILMLLFNILTVRRILAASRARRGLRGQKSGENDKDREMENRRKSIVLLFSITGSFILLWGTLVVFPIYSLIKMSFFNSVTDPRYVTDQASVMLQVLSSCTNTCIYVLTQRKFREEVNNAVKYPLNLILKLLKR
ncbi:uncharacterized protein LOC134341315 [Mobula hypostoma]|uniref:uncharacterized protein LOC134341315 n=1 Tax=Mobula hypostoma TaxID=723540 RepID=UPI002FC33FE0